jgi:hypothetical protein
MARQAPDCAAILDNVRRVNESPETPIEDAERLLTDGYACVMRAEGKRLRLRGRLEKRVTTLGAEPGADEVGEITELALGIARVDGEIEQLRTALDRLAARVRRLRVA